MDLAAVLGQHFAAAGGSAREGALEAALVEFTRRRAPRSRAHAQMTAFTGLLSRLNGTLTEPVRDMMAWVPRPANALIFDAALNYSMAGSHRLDAATSAARRFELQVASCHHGPAKRKSLGGV